jgi:hypothetical protein
MLEPGKGKAPAMLIGTPGLTAPLITLSGGGIRGMFKINNETSVIVCGVNVYKVTSTFISTLIGTIKNDARPVQIAWNGVNVVITSQETIYSLTLNGAVATELLTSVGMVDVIGDFFVASKAGTNNFIWADALTTNFDGLNIQATNSVADDLVGCKTARRAIYFFGSKSIEPWYESGGTDVPFSRIDGGVFEVGCIAKDSIAENDAIFWLGGDEKGAGIVWSVAGGAPKRISTPAIEYAIAQWPDKTDAEAFCYNQEGHSFYVLSSASGDETWVYDITFDEWHQRGSIIDTDDPEVEVVIPGWNTTNESGAWTFTNADFTAEATP